MAGSLITNVLEKHTSCFPFQKEIHIYDGVCIGFWYLKRPFTRIVLFDAWTLGFRQNIGDAFHFVDEEADLVGDMVWPGPMGGKQQNQVSTRASWCRVHSFWHCSNVLLTLHLWPFLGNSHLTTVITKWSVTPTDWLEVLEQPKEDLRWPLQNDRPLV